MMQNTLDRAQGIVAGPDAPPPVTPPDNQGGPLVWMKSKATTVVHGLVTSVWVGGFAIGAIITVVAAGIGVYALVNHGVIQQLIPAPPTIVQPPEPIKISLHGPSPSVVISGVSSVFTVDVSGPAGTPEWQVFPPAAANASASADGKRVDVLASADGKFSIIATISGDGRQLASARAEVEAMAQVIQQPLPPEQPTPQPQPVEPDPTPVKPPAETVAERMARQLAAVNSANRAVEARKVANVITSIVGRINAGAIGPHMDIANLVHDEANNALGPAAPSWDLFLSAIALVLDNFKNQGLISTAATTTPILTEIAGVLLKAQ